METMNCPECNSDLKKTITGNFEINYCDNIECFSHFSYQKRECNNHHLQAVRFYSKNNSLYIRKQCFCCGESVSGFKKADFENIDLLPIYKEGISDDFCDIGFTFQYQQRYYEKGKFLKREREKEVWFAEHNNYLKSDEWKSKRLLVLKRDNYTCQSCLLNKATQIHHKSYRYWQNEPLFDLISVCFDCHELITKIDRGELIKKAF
jgi:hypothetical protein